MPKFYSIIQGSLQSYRVRLASKRLARNMATRQIPAIALDEKEKKIRDFLVGAAQHYAESHRVEVPVLRFAGGWVRDKLLGLENKDIDIAIDCMTGKKFYQDAMKEYEPIHAKLHPDTNILGRLAEIKKDAEKSKHMETANTKLFDLELDLVNLRTETYNEQSRNPEIEFGTAQEDAMRRDATINALFYNLNTQEVEDFTKRGIQDLLGDKPMIRTPLDPEQTFRDDPLRILRLVRFACRFGFEIDEQALHWMQDESIQAVLERKISRERILTEIQKMLQNPDPSKARRALRILLERNLYGTIFTIPDVTHDMLPIVETTRIRPALDELLRILEDQKQTLFRTQLLRSKQEQYWAWLICALLPRIGQSLPSALHKKSAPETLAARIARDGLKIDNDTMRVIKEVDIHALPPASDLCKAFSEQSSQPDSPGKRKRSTVDRITTGMAIRRWGQDWRMIVLAAFLGDFTSTNGPEEAEKIRERYARWLQFIESEKLGEVWNAKAFPATIDGGEITKAVREAKGNIATGPWMGECVRTVFEYQLREQDQATKDGAVKAVLEAIDSGHIKVQLKDVR